MSLLITAYTDTKHIHLNDCETIDGLGEGHLHNFGHRAMEGVRDITFIYPISVAFSHTTDYGLNLYLARAHPLVLDGTGYDGTRICIYGLMGERAQIWRLFFMVMGYFHNTF